MTSTTPTPAPTPDVDAYLASLPPHGWVRIPYPDDISQWTTTHVALALISLDPRRLDRP